MQQRKYIMFVLTNGIQGLEMSFCSFNMLIFMSHFIQLFSLLPFNLRIAITSQFVFIASYENLFYQQKNWFSKLSILVQIIKNIIARLLYISCVCIDCEFQSLAGSNMLKKESIKKLFNDWFHFACRNIEFLFIRYEVLGLNLNII